MEEKKTPSFEERLERLSRIVAKIEGEVLPLEESISLYKEGEELIKSLQASIKEAEEKVGEYFEVEK